MAKPKVHVPVKQYFFTGTIQDLKKAKFSIIDNPFDGITAYRDIDDINAVIIIVNDLHNKLPKGLLTINKSLNVEDYEDDFKDLIKKKLIKIEESV